MSAHGTALVWCVRTSTYQSARSQYMCIHTLQICVLSTEESGMTIPPCFNWRRWGNNSLRAWCCVRNLHILFVLSLPPVALCAFDEEFMFSILTQRVMWPNPVWSDTGSPYPGQQFNGAYGNVYYCNTWTLTVVSLLLVMLNLFAAKCECAQIHVCVPCALFELLRPPSTHAYQHVHWRRTNRRGLHHNPARYWWFLRLRHNQGIVEVL